VQYCTTVVGYSMLSGVTNTYSGFFFITLKPWHERKSPEEKYEAIMASLNRRMGASLRESPSRFRRRPSGIGTSGGVTFILEDRSGKDIDFLWQHPEVHAEAKKRPEIARATTTFLPTCRRSSWTSTATRCSSRGRLQPGLPHPAGFHGRLLRQLLQPLRRQWQVYIQARGVPHPADQLGQFYVRNAAGNTVPLSAVTSWSSAPVPSSPCRYNLYRSPR